MLSPLPRRAGTLDSQQPVRRPDMLLSRPRLSPQLVGGKVPAHAPPGFSRNGPRPHSSLRRGPPFGCAARDCGLRSASGGKHARTRDGDSCFRWHLRLNLAAVDARLAEPMDCQSRDCSCRRHAVLCQRPLHLRTRSGASGRSEHFYKVTRGVTSPTSMGCLAPVVERASTSACSARKSPSAGQPQWM